MMKHLRAVFGMLVLALVFLVHNANAATLIWTNSNDYWQSTTAWSPAGSFPGSGDSAYFTNAGSYSVTLSNDVTNLQSNFFSNAADTLAIITLNLGDFGLNPIASGNNPGAFNIGDLPGSTAVVWLASSTLAGKGLVVPGRIVVGRFGHGTMYFTNGNVSVATTILANAPAGCGTLVLSGPNVVWSNTLTLAIGNNSNTFGSSLVISNSATMVVLSTFRLGSSSSQGGSSNNTLILDSNARLSTHTGPVVIGNLTDIGAPSPSYNNSAIVRGGAVWNNNDKTFVIGFSGGPATGNVLTVETSGFVTNISQLTITPSNTLNMAGGTLKATTTCLGTIRGFGTMFGSATISTGGFLTPANSLGTLAFSNSVVVANGATTTVDLGTNVNATVVRGALTLGGTLNITDGGGFTNTTYTLFTYTGALTYNGLTVSTTPATNFSYEIDTSNPGVVSLHVFDPLSPPVADFDGTPTEGSVPLVVSFTDSSLGTITNRFWNFGDGKTTNTTATSLVHTYSTDGVFNVSLTVFSPSGTDTLTQVGYITATNVPLPVITSDVTISNGMLQVGNVIVVIGGDTNMFNVEATEPETNSLSFLWSFGDGVTNTWSPSNSVEHAYSPDDCGAYHASLSISNGLGTITTNFTVVVPCQLTLGKTGMKLSFAKTNADSAAVSGTFDLPDGFTFAGKLATLNVGGAQLSFLLPAKGAGVNGGSKFTVPKFNKKTGQWALKAGFKGGSWHSEWANYSMVNSNIPKPGALVSDLPVILLLDTEGFMATTNLHYTATQGKSGAAK